MSSISPLPSQILCSISASAWCLPHGVICRRTQGVKFKKNLATSTMQVSRPNDQAAGTMSAPSAPSESCRWGVQVSSRNCSRPDGPPLCTAFERLVVLGCRRHGEMMSRRVMPMGTSIGRVVHFAGQAEYFAACSSRCPWPVPSPPLRMMNGTLHRSHVV